MNRGNKGESNLCLGRLERLDEAKIELWDLLDARSYRPSWGRNPGQHPGGLMARWLPERRDPLNDDWWRR